MQKLNVQLLGDFALEYDGKRIWLGNSYKTKVFQLLQILLYHGVEGITTSALIDQLYGQDAEGDTANNLRVTVYNLRRLLEKSELPQEHYVRAESGRYRFVAPFPVEVDALQFEAPGDGRSGGEIPFAERSVGSLRRSFSVGSFRGGMGGGGICPL